MLSLYSSTVKNVSKNVEMSFVEKEKFLVSLISVTKQCQAMWNNGICDHSTSEVSHRPTRSCRKINN